MPAYPWAYASVLSAAGVKYFAAGANDDRGPQPLYGRWQTRSPFWWQGPDGAKVLMAYTRQYSNLWFICGLPPREAGCRESLPTFFQTFESPGYRPDAVLMFGSQLENTDLIPGEGEFVRRWNAKYSWPRLELATFRDYFELDREEVRRPTRNSTRRLRPLLGRRHRHRRAVRRPLSGDRKPRAGGGDAIRARAQCTGPSGRRRSTGSAASGRT